MNMRKYFTYLSKFFAATLFLAAFTACTSDNEPCDEGCGEKVIFTETFDGAEAILSGPTAAGENLKEDFPAEDGFVCFKENKNHKDIWYGINTDTEGLVNASNGGVWLSNYHTFDVEGSTDWYSFTNQSSVYNTKAASGENFAVIYGMKNDFGGDYAKIYMKEGLGYHFLSMKVCNSAYTAGVALYGNDFSDGSMKEKGGYLYLLVKGYKDGKVLTDTNGKEIIDRFTLMDFRNKKEIFVKDWTDFFLTNVHKHEVDYIEFSMEGSDSQTTLGLNTPAYACIDDLQYGYKK